MFFTITDELRLMIEAIQSKSFVTLGADIKKLTRENIEEANRIFQDRDLTEKLAFFKEKPYGLIPEHIYSPSPEFFKFMLSIHTTKFDNPTFLGRFANLIPLCHELYTDGDISLRKNIVVTSLPFLNLNGICFEEIENTHIVFLNEGLLSSIPGIYEHLLPLLEPQWFKKGTPEDNLEEVLGRISGLHFFKSSYLDSRKSTKIRKPSAYEHWIEDIEGHRWLEAHLKNEVYVKELRHPSQYPFNANMGMFLACRGAFTFILGHEFSHVYNNHCQCKNDERMDLRDPAFLNSLRRNFSEEMKKYDGLDSNYVNYHINQPLEEEADAHALQCVLKYCNDNNLDDQRSLCVILGAIATFVVMVIHEHFHTIRDFGSANAKQYLSLNPFVRNFFFMGEHPSPITRLEMALKHEQFKDSPIIQQLLIMNDQLVSLCDQITNVISHSATEIEEFMSSSEILRIDPANLFGEHLALGASDLSLGHHAKVKKFLSPKKAPVIHLFKK